MKLAFLTTDDPLYLPDFFEKVLGEWSRETLAVYVSPPLYRNETALQAMRKYHRTFGLADSLQLSGRVFAAKVRRRSIASVCAKHGVAYQECADVNAPSFLQRLKELRPDVIVSVSCPQIFKRPLIQLPPRGILNIHGAILPQYRGVMPSFWMLANGETEAGVSIYFVNDQIDAGELCAQRIFNIEPNESLHQFIRRSKAIAAELLMEVLRTMMRTEIPRRPLDLAAGSYFSWPDRDAVARFRSRGRRVW